MSCAVVVVRNGVEENKRNVALQYECMLIVKGCVGVFVNGCRHLGLVRKVGLVVAQNGDDGCIS